VTDLIEQQYNQLGRWNRWADRLVFAGLRTSGGEPLQALAAFQHTLETEVNWLRRIEAAPEPDLPYWTAATLDQCDAYATEAETRFVRVAGSLDSARLASTFSYANSQGATFTGLIADALLHMFMHSMQYRGEAAAFLNAAGHRLPDMDFMVWMRGGEPV
jgi:uncharacterized damage-inducible protein DinB